jgi:hypothetical protein
MTIIRRPEEVAVAEQFKRANPRWSWAQCETHAKAFFIETEFTHPECRGLIDAETGKGFCEYKPDFKSCDECIYGGGTKDPRGETK